MLLEEFWSGKHSNVYISVGNQILLLWSSLIKVEQIIMKSQRGAQTFAYHYMFHWSYHLEQLHINKFTENWTVCGHVTNQMSLHCDSVSYYNSKMISWSKSCREIWLHFPHYVNRGWCLSDCFRRKLKMEAALHYSKDTCSVSWRW